MISLNELISSSLKLDVLTVYAFKSYLLRMLFNVVSSVLLSPKKSIKLSFLSTFSLNLSKLIELMLAAVPHDRDRKIVLDEGERLGDPREKVPGGHEVDAMGALALEI